VGGGNWVAAEAEELEPIDVAVSSSSTSSYDHHQSRRDERRDCLRAPLRTEPIPTQRRSVGRRSARPLVWQRHLMMMMMAAGLFPCGSSVAAAAAAAMDDDNVQCALEDRPNELLLQRAAAGAPRALRVPSRRQEYGESGGSQRRQLDPAASRGPMTALESARVKHLAVQGRPRGSGPSLGQVGRPPVPCWHLLRPMLIEDLVIGVETKLDD
jgi:hypothetical protein